jgi:hypothetical protein
MFASLILRALGKKHENKKYSLRHIRVITLIHMYMTRIHRDESILTIIVLVLQYYY